MLIANTENNFNPKGNTVANPIPPKTNPFATSKKKFAKPFPAQNLKKLPLNKNLAK